MLRYEDYIRQKIQMDEEMVDTRRRESEAVKQLEEQRQQSNSDLFDSYLEKKRVNNQEWYDKIGLERNKFKAERRMIYERQTILTTQWKAQLLKIESGEISNVDIFGITPPTSGGLLEEGGDA